ncbi:MAG: FHA domain-containing protein [Clostridium sp.]|uniref:FHA domain-containing protein n=1 Tax=Clostridium sp. TaxID=1506 RepID=UPI0025B97E3D|nr:FHA domain-containing protein [Clostridium sp.]MBS5927385.1 FHA domain-containing protein [Clostridium sp.]
MNGFVDTENLIRKTIDFNSINKKEVISIKELSRNQILLNIDVDNINNPKEIIYYISGLMSVKKYVSTNKDLSTKGFVRILLKICKNYLQCEVEKNIDEKRLYLFEDYIYIEPLNESIRFMYLPSNIGTTARPIDKLRLTLLKLVDAYGDRNLMSSVTAKKIKGELTNKFVDVYTLVENLNKIINSIQEKPISEKIEKNKAVNSGSGCKIDHVLAGTFLLIATQILTGVLSVSLYKMSWDNPNLMLLSIVIIILIDLVVSFIIINFLILPTIKKKNEKKPINIEEDSYSYNKNYHHLNTSKILSDDINIQEFSGSSFLNESEEAEYDWSISSSDETTYLEQVSVIGGEFDETTLLNQLNNRDEIVAFLISDEENKNEKITINKDEYIIGRLKQKVDYPIQNGTVGKIHAKINYIEKEFYITDLESKNGTYLNGERLNSLEKYKLKDGDNVTFSNAPYIFKR